MLLSCPRVARGAVKSLGHPEGVLALAGGSEGFQSALKLSKSGSGHCEKSEGGLRALLRHLDFP